MASDPEALMDRTIMAILTALMQVILLATVFIPTAIGMIKDLDPSYKVLMEAIITITIVSVIIGIIMTYVRRS